MKSQYARDELQWAFTWIFSGSHWTFSLLGSAEPTGQVIIKLWRLPPNRFILFTKFSVSTWKPRWMVTIQPDMSPPRSKVTLHASLPVCVDQVSLTEGHYLLLDKTSSVTDSENEVLVGVFVQREPADRQLEVEVVLRCKVDLRKRKKVFLGQIISCHIHIISIFATYGVGNNYLGFVRPQTATLSTLQFSHCESTSPCIQKNMSRLPLKTRCHVHIIRYQVKAP